MILHPKILIVDDEPRMCESLRSLLSGHDYEIFTANSGTKAMEILSQEAFDLVLLDMVIPDMDGHQLMDYISNQYPDTFVIVITGYASLDSAVAALRKGAYDYLRKPFEYEELLKTVQNALDQKRLKYENELIDGRLKVTEERYRYLVDNSPDIICTLDLDGNFTFVSDAAERLIGYKPEELIGKHYSTIIYEEDLERAKWFFDKERVMKHAVSGAELRLKTRGRKEGLHHYLIVELRSTGMYDKPASYPKKQYLGTYVVARDVSDRRRLEAQLHQAQKMEAIGTLAGGIAHDFNNLLMAIQGYASLMLLNTDPSHPHYEKLKNIEKCVQSGAELTRQLLGFARGGKYNVRPLNLNELINQTSQMIGRTMKEIIIHKKYDENLWPVEADQGQMEQVLLNLYVNAWQAMPGGGELFLETRNITLGEQFIQSYNMPPGHYVKITVADTGIGMDEETRQRIFEPFFTTKKIGGGTGLGLASVYGIVKNHNGIIEVKSKKGEGTTFEIYLPASEKKIEEKTRVRERLVKRSGTILLVDDEDMIIEVGTEILRALGYKVIPAKSGEEAINIYRNNKDKIDLIILDIIMPGMGGRETYNHLKQINPNVKVLLSSGYSIDGEASEILERGCDGFIQKPFSVKALSKKVSNIEGKSIL